MSASATRRWSERLVRLTCAAVVVWACAWPAAAGEEARRHRRAYCASGDPAWRAHLAPAVFEGRVRSASAERRADYALTLQVRRVLKAAGGWPERGAAVRLTVEGAAPGCGPRAPVLRPGRVYLVFAERRAHQARALGPPLLRTKDLVKRVRHFFSPDYLRAARVRGLNDTRVAAGARVRLACEARGRPPPQVTWYRDGQPLPPAARRLRVHHTRKQSVLVIGHARPEDTAQYECRAQGVVGGPASAFANVTVVAVATPPDTTWGAPCPMPNPDSYCLNGGTCLFFETVGEPACKCPEGFTGQRCENKDVSNRSNADLVPAWTFDAPKMNSPYGKIEKK